MKPQHKGNDWLYQAPPVNDIDMIEAYFAGHAYDPHRHDTYAIGRTYSGVQSFHYRGALRNSLPGGTMVLHPDEVHDGHAGNPEGFLYRMMYVEPALIQQVLQGKPLPFIKGGLTDNGRLSNAVNTLLRSMDIPLEPLEKEDALYDLAMAMNEASGARDSTRRFDYAAAQRAREMIDVSLHRPLTLAELSSHANRDRWGLSRDFRQVFGTSPHRYQIMRRLDIVKRCLVRGMDLADASLIAGFFDQSHMSRHFSHAFGLPPGKWQKIATAALIGIRKR
jgi:AraC-like DNA-binding protein